jgi:type VI secretion system protein ImpG
MSPELLEFFHRELQFLAGQGPEFARRHPDIAPSLETPSRANADPHAERMIQAFAWLNARVHQQLDGDLQHLAETFLAVVFPHAQRPFPSCAVVQLSPRTPAGLPPDGQVVPRGSLLESEPVGGLRCRFQTVMPVVLSGIELMDARFQQLKSDAAPSFAPQARSVLRLQLRSQIPRRGIRLGPHHDLRIFLKAPRATAFWLYELLVREAVGVSVSDERGQSIEHAGSGLLSGAGFRPDESLLPSQARTPAAHLLLLEFFAFPEKHLFVDLHGLDSLHGVDLFGTVEVAVFFSQPNRELESLVSAGTVRLNCTPVVNLFPTRAEPLALTHERPEYPVRPDARSPEGVEVFCIDRVSAVSPEGTVRVREFYEPQRPSEADPGEPAWIARRRFGTGGMAGATHWLGLADPHGEFLNLDRWTLDIELQCLNGDVPAALPFAGPGPRLNLENDPGLLVECVVPPTRRLEPPLAREAQGKLVALLALQSLPLFCENPAAALRLREVVGLWNPNPSREAAAIVESLVESNARPVLEEVWIGADRCFARGMEIVVDLDESRLPGRSSFLFASVLEHFLSWSSSLNCFTRLVVRSSESRKVLHRFAVRAGDQLLVSLN